MNPSFVKLPKGTKLYSVKIDPNTLTSKVWFLDIDIANRLKNMVKGQNAVVIESTLIKDVQYINKIVPIKILDDPRVKEKKAIFLIQITPQIVALGFSDISLLKQIDKPDRVKGILKDDFWRLQIRRNFPLRGKFIYYTEYLRLWNEDPKTLYNIINSKSKIISLKAVDFPVLADKMYSDDIYYELGEHSQLITSQLKLRLKDLPLLRGDVIHIEWAGEYRNTGKIMWDGVKVITLGYDNNIDEYGYVPREFTIPEFSYDHFHDSIAHNLIIWLSPETVNQAIANFDLDTQQSFISDMFNQRINIIAIKIQLLARERQLGSSWPENRMRITKEEFETHLRTTLPYINIV